MWTDTDWMTLLTITGLIFLARVCDVTLGTLRIVFISRGQKYIAPAFAFFEMMIWLFAVRQIMQNLDNVFYFVAYAFGFSTGVFVGLNVEEKLAMGLRLVRTITRKDASALVAALREHHFGVTNIAAEGNSGPVNILYSVIKRSHAEAYIALVKEFNPNAFYTVADVRLVNESAFPEVKSTLGRHLHGLRSWAKFK